MIAQILLADDNEQILAMLGEYLALKGHRLIMTKDGSEMVQNAIQHRPNLIITDIQMPGLYGSSAYQVLQKEISTNNIPLIFISAHSQEKLAAILPNDPKTRFLQKPLDFGRLDAMIDELLPLGGYCP
ncbi:MAG: response regulator [Elusimicrobiota bacterium]